MSEIGKRLDQRVRELRTQRAERLTQEELARTMFNEKPDRNGRDFAPGPAKSRGRVPVY